mmetsp:Transcript_16841/g.45678  ORF Transcript_16841/g.45678 Transcript_16841/m.45678 type:complete len:509 (-) Transcript_16841:762-2288(-)
MCSEPSRPPSESCSRCSRWSSSRSAWSSEQCSHTVRPAIVDMRTVHSASRPCAVATVSARLRIGEPSYEASRVPAGEAPCSPIRAKPGEHCSECLPEAPHASAIAECCERAPAADIGKSGGPLLASGGDSSRSSSASTAAPETTALDDGGSGGIGGAAAATAVTSGDERRPACTVSLPRPSSAPPWAPFSAGGGKGRGAWPESCCGGEGVPRSEKSSQPWSSEKASEQSSIILQRSRTAVKTASKVAWSSGCSTPSERMFLPTSRWRERGWASSRRRPSETDQMVPSDVSSMARVRSEPRNSILPLNESSRPRGVEPSSSVPSGGGVPTSPRRLAARLPGVLAPCHPTRGSSDPSPSSSSSSFGASSSPVSSSSFTPRNGVNSVEKRSVAWSCSDGGVDTPSTCRSMCVVGGAICFLSSLPQSSDAKNGCAWTALAPPPSPPSRVVGVLSSSALISAVASFDTVGGTVYWQRMIICTSRPMSALLNGLLPMSISKTRQPSVHQSTEAS